MFKKIMTIYVKWYECKLRSSALKSNCSETKWYVVITLTCHNTIIIFTFPSDSQLLKYIKCRDLKKSLLVLFLNNILKFHVYIPIKSYIMPQKYFTVEPLKVLCRRNFAAICVEITQKRLLTNIFSNRVIN